jgi:hypothetical protein
LTHLADKFPAYLSETRPDAKDGREDWIDFLIELASLELLCYQVYEGPGLEHATHSFREDLHSGHPTGLTAVPAPCLRLFWSEFPVAAALCLARRNERVEIPARQNSWTAVTRENYVVKLHELDEAEFNTLSSWLDGSGLSHGARRPLETPDTESTERLEEWARKCFIAISPASRTYIDSAVQKQSGAHSVLDVKRPNY